MSNIVYEEIEVGSTIVRVVDDEDPMDPREWDNLGTMMCLHGRYKLGDKHDFRTPDEFEQWWAENGVSGVRLPLYLYDHSGITMATSPFSCPWDSGQVGYIYMTAEKMREAGLGAAKAKECLEGEVGDYDTYIRNAVVGWTVIDKETEKCLDSCWGYYSIEDCLDEAKQVAEALSKKLREERAKDWVEETHGAEA